MVDKRHSREDESSGFLRRDVLKSQVGGILATGGLAGATGQVVAQDDCGDEDFVYSPTDPNPGDTVQFDACLSAGGMIEWDFDDGSGEQRGSSMSHTFDEPGTYDVVMIVTDSRGNSVEYSRTLRVESDEPDPISVSVSGPTEVDPETTHTYYADASGVTGTVDYSWSYHVDGESQPSKFPNAGDSLTLDVDGTADRSLTVTGADDAGTDHASLDIDVSDPSLRATLSYTGPEDPLVGQTGTFEVDVEGAVGNVSYDWRVHVPGASQPSPLDSDDRTVTVDFASSGSYGVQVTVEDETESVTETTNVTADKLEFDVEGPENVSYGEEGTFEVIDVSTTQGEVSYSWEVRRPDGSREAVGTGEEVTVQFDSRGDYRIEVTGRDDEAVTEEWMLTSCSAQFVIENARLVQDVTDTRVVDENGRAFFEVEDPAPVYGRNTTVVFDLQVNGADPDDLFSDGAETTLTIETDPGSGLDLEFSFDQSDWEDGFAQYLEPGVEIDEFYEAFPELVSDLGVPIFELTGDVETVRIAIEDPSDHIEDAAATISVPNEAVEVDSLDIGFIGVMGPGASDNYGEREINAGSGRPGAVNPVGYDDYIDEELEYIRNEFPVAEVNVFRAETGIVGVPSQNDDVYDVNEGFRYHDDAEAAYRVVHERTKDADIDPDVVVLVTPDDYFEYHNKPNYGGLASGQQAVIVEVGNPYTVAHEIGHYLDDVVGLYSSESTTSGGADVESGDLTNPMAQRRNGGDYDQCDSDDRRCYSTAHARYRDSSLSRADDLESDDVEPDEPGLVSTAFDLNDGFSRDEGVPSFMSYTHSGNDRTDARLQQALIDNGFHDPYLDQSAESQAIVSLSGRVEDGGITIEETDTFHSRPMASSSGDVSVRVLAVDGSVIDERTTNLGVADVPAGGDVTVHENEFDAKAPFPEEAATITVEANGSETSVEPIYRSLLTVLNRVPEGAVTGDASLPDQLSSELQRLRELLGQGDYDAARSLLSEIRQRVRTLVDGQYETLPNRANRDEVIATLDDLSSRTTTLSSSGSDDPQAVGSNDDRPTDPDDDGLYEDVNGDGATNLADAGDLFQHRNGDAVQNNVDAYDFSSNDEIDLADVVQLFSENTE